MLRDVSGPRDAFVEFRSLFRAAHVWLRHDSLIQLFDFMLKRSGYRTRLEVHVPNAGTEDRVDIVAHGLFHNTDVAFEVSIIAAVVMTPMSPTRLEDVPLSALRAAPSSSAKKRRMQQGRADRTKYLGSTVVG